MNAERLLRLFERVAEAPDAVAKLRQLVLDLAVRGRLVAQDERDEPTKNLVARIYEARQSEVAKGRLKKQALLPELDDETPFGLPKTWKWVPLQNLLKGDSQNGFSKKPDDSPDGIPILRISAGTVRSDYIVAEEEHKLIGRTNSEIEANFSLDEGDLLVCRFNGNRDYVGRFSLFKNYLGIDPIYPDKLIRIRVFRRLTVPDLVRYFANSNPIRQKIEQYCATTVGNWGISATNLKKTPIPLPPLAEQHRIVAKVDQLMALCDQLEAAIGAQQHATSRLLDALIAEALADSPEPQTVEAGVQLALGF